LGDPAASRNRRLCLPSETIEGVANVPSATQALAVLKLLARHAAPQPAAAIARELGLPRSTTYHLLAALREEGFVVHLADERRYGLGLAAFELGSAYARQEPLRRIAAPALARLVAATGHTGHFALLHGRDVLYVVEERAPGRPGLVTDVGVRLPAPLTASGIAILAALPPQQVAALFPTRAALVRRTERGPATLTALRAALAAARRDGYATEEESVTPGFASVAVAVPDHRGYPVAAVAVTLPVAAYDEAARDALVAHARRAAERISRGVVGRPQAAAVRAARAR
jgi:DNA-binding IclR family transcriptional regulator